MKVHNIRINTTTLAPWHPRAMSVTIGASSPKSGATYRAYQFAPLRVDTVSPLTAFICVVIDYPGYVLTFGHGDS